MRRPYKSGGGGAKAKAVMGQSTVGNRPIADLPIAPLVRLTYSYWMDADEDQSASLTPLQGAALGCLAAFLLAASVGFILLFGLAWGGAHCQPVPDCQRANEGLFFVQVSVLLVSAGLLGVAIRFFTLSVSRRLTARPGLAIAINVIVMMLSLWLAFRGVVELMLVI